MLDLNFQVEGAEPERVAAAPLMRFKLRVTERLSAGMPPTSIYAVALSWQLRIEPARRRYSPREQERLLDLFGTPERWGQTLRPWLWTHASVVVRPFVASTAVHLPVPCSYDFSLAATKYFDALEGGDIPLCFLFSGTIFYEGEQRGLQVAQVAWDKEAYFRLPATTWKDLMDLYYPNSAWLCLRKGVFDQLSEYKRRRGLTTWEQALETLLAPSSQPLAPMGEREGQSRLLSQYSVIVLGRGWPVNGAHKHHLCRTLLLYLGEGGWGEGKGVGDDMNRSLVDPIVKAVLYEGYILYPYRPSVKNRQRWTFGGLYPEAYCRAPGGTEASSNQTECLVQGSPQATLEVTVRFLHLTERVVGELPSPLAEWREDMEPELRPVEALRIGDQTFHTWQEAEERSVHLNEVPLAEILNGPRRQTFRFSGRRWLEPLCREDGKVAGILVRQQQGVEGAIEAKAVEVRDGLFKVTVRVMNRTPLDDAGRASRDDGLLRSLVSTHTIVGVRAGEFISLMDPPEVWREAAAACRNLGTWPVLVGEQGDRDTMLSSPIILYDYPQVAPESPGDLFDATEIDEILTLRVLTLTEEEQQAAAAVDGRVRDLLARTQALAREELLGLHGVARTVRPLSGESP
jgi:hydrogenase maturation protease